MTLPPDPQALFWTGHENEQEWVRAAAEQQLEPQALSTFAARLPGAPQALLPADLALALACLQRSPQALEQLERLVVKACRAVTTLGGDRSFVDEVGSVLREQLLLPRDGRSPKLSEYQGRAPLSFWLRTVALGLGLNLRRSRRELPAPDIDALAERMRSGPSLDTALLKERHRHDFNAAFRAAAAALAPHERTLLRLSWINGLSIDQLAVIHRIHRATVARRVHRAREGLLSQLRKELTDRVKLDPTEVESFIRALQSQADLTPGMFRSAPQ